MIKILADENMPYVDELFADLASITKKSGRDIVSADLIDIDVLLVRSITKVDADLLAQANKLSFVGTATIGVDHIDQQFLEQRKIAWSSAPGCNAVAVAEYVLSALSILLPQQLKDKTVAIVGAGNIGTRLAAKLDALGVSHFYCDPLKQRAGMAGDFRSLDEVVKADVISLHVPITRGGSDPTYHMVDNKFLARLKPDTVLINSCRGDVVDNQALYNALAAGLRIKTVMDVWQNEPSIDLRLLGLVNIATPHIAGYSLEGKANGTYMLYKSWCQSQQKPATKTLESLLPKMSLNEITFDGELDNDSQNALLRFVYDIRDDDELCRTHGIDAKGFDNLRKQYKVRREFSALSVLCSQLTTQNTLAALGFSTQARDNSKITPSAIGEN